MAKITDAELQKLADSLAATTLSGDFKGEWLKLDSIADWIGKILGTEAFKDAVEDVLGVLEKAIKIYGIVLSIIDKFGRTAIDFANAWSIAIKVVLKIFKKLLKSFIDTILFGDLLGNGIYTTQVLLQPNGKGQFNHGELGNILRDAVNRWPGHPEVNNNVCGMIFIPYTILGLNNPYLSEMIDNINNIADFAAKKFNSGNMKTSNAKKTTAMAEQKELTKYRTELRTYLEALYQETLGGRQTTDTVGGDSTSINNVLTSYREKIRKKDKSFLKNTLEYRYASYKGIAEIKARMFDLKSSRSSLGPGIDKGYSAKRDDGFLEIFLAGPQNNNFIIKEIYVTVINRTSKKAEVAKCYENRKLLPLVTYKETNSLLEQDLELMSRSFFTYFLTSNKEYPVSLFEDSDLNDQFESLTNEELKLFYAREKMIDLFPDSEDYHESLYTDPNAEDSNFFTYDHRFMLSTRNPLTPFKLYLKLDKADNDLSDKVADSETYSTFVTINTVKGDTLIVHDDYLDPAVTTPNLFPVGWGIGEMNFSQNEHMSFLVVKNEIPREASTNEWLSASTPSMNMEYLMKGILPREVYDGLRDGLGYLDDFLDGIDSIAGGLSLFGAKFDTILSDLMFFANFIKNGILQKFYNFLKAVLLEDIPVLYVSVWTGSSRAIPDIIMNALRQEGIQKATMGGRILFMDSATLAYILNVLKVYNDFKAFIQNVDSYIPNMELPSVDKDIEAITTEDIEIKLIALEDQLESIGATATKAKSDLFKKGSTADDVYSVVSDITNNLKEIDKINDDPEAEEYDVRAIQLDVESILEFISNIQSIGRKIPGHDIKFKVSDLNSLLK